MTRLARDRSALVWTLMNTPLVDGRPLSGTEANDVADLVLGPTGERRGGPAHPDCDCPWGPSPEGEHLADCASRATTGHDRGRELAERWEQHASTLHRDARAARERGHDAWESAVDVLTAKAGTYARCAEQLRALAAPAETKAGDGHAWAPDSSDEERAEWQCRWCSSRLHGDVRCVHGPATPPAPEGEAGSGDGSLDDPCGVCGCLRAQHVGPSVPAIAGQCVSGSCSDEHTFTPAPAGPAQAEGAGGAS